jgi:hypothetical protein
MISTNWNGKWDKWELSEVNDEQAWVYRGNKVNVETNCWYDRLMGQRLFFGQFTPPPGVMDWERFGSPVPPYPFFIESSNRWIPKKPLYWMYPTEKGEPGTVENVQKSLVRHGCLARKYCSLYQN